MKSESARKTRWGIFAAVAVAALTIGGMVRAGVIPTAGQANGTTGGGQKVALNVASNTAPVTLGNFKNGFSSIIDPALQAVVNISSTKMVHPQNNYQNFMNDPFFRQFFGGQGQGQEQQPQSEREESLGSGVIVNANGYILTNNHVVAGAQTVEVATQSQRIFKAKVIGTDPRTDIAVLKIDASNLPTLTVGNSDDLKVGDLVFAIGDPFGIGETATMGIVSATKRAMGGQIEHYENFIQTDAAINPGNSGGALINANGDVIGINTAIIAGQNGGGNEGIGFAIPINMAVNIMNQIVEHGKVIRGYLGVEIQDVTPTMAEAFGMSHGGGALVADVTPNSPAAKGDLERGDIIEKLNGKPVADRDELSVEISEMAPGTTVHMEVYRKGQTLEKDITLGTYPNSGPGAATSTNGQPGAVLKGMQVQPLTPDIAQQLNLPSGVTGVVVSQLDPSSDAAAAGIQQGDVIQEVNHKPVHNVDEYQAAAATTDGKPVLLLIDRNGATIFVVVQPQG